MSVLLGLRGRALGSRLRLARSLRGFRVLRRFVLAPERAESDETFFAVAYVLIPLTFWVAGALPARVLGLGWLGSFLVS